MTLQVKPADVDYLRELLEKGMKSKYLERSYKKMYKADISNLKLPAG